MNYLFSIFYDSQNNFEWPSVAAGVALLASIISVCGVIYNASVSKKINENTIKQQEKVSERSLALQRELNEKNFEGSVVATARIEWIQEVRKQSVAFITSFYKLTNYIKRFDYDYFREPDHDIRIERIEKDQELISLINELKEKGTLLVLYFGPDKSGNNEFIDYIVNLIIEMADGVGKYYEVDTLLGQERSIISMKDFLRLYFKAEWKRANGQIEDSKVQEYLEKDKLYRDIMEIYKDGLAAHKEDTEVFYNILRDKYLK
jgi:hypothetical protein